VPSPEEEEVRRDITAFQRYGLEEFEADRRLAYLRGWAYHANVEFNDAELTPPAACQIL